MSFAILSLAVWSALYGMTVLAAPEIVASAWYAGWHATEGYEVSNLTKSWHKYNTLFYSFAATSPDVNTLSLDESDAKIIPEFVRKAHEHGLAAHISMGGWSGSRWFSSNVATPENRTAFVQTVVEFAEQYNMDGINFDWEYPAKSGIGCNVHSTSDTENFLSFLQELRMNAIGARLTLSAATPIIPFADPSGNPSKDVSGFAEALDYITIMNYDVWGPWTSSVGPNSPLNDTCASGADQLGSAVSAVKAWTAAGFPAKQIVLGVAAYGHSYSVPTSDALNGDTLQAYPKFDASNQPLGDKWDDTSSVDVCGNPQGPGGTFTFWGLVEGGFLTTEGVPASNIVYRYDECSETPYVYNPQSEVLISYDNARSFTAKGNFIKEAGLLGYAMWEAGGDYDNKLVDAIKEAVGFTLKSTDSDT